MKVYFLLVHARFAHRTMKVQVVMVAAPGVDFAGVACQMRDEVYGDTNMQKCVNNRCCFDTYSMPEGQPI